MGSSSSSLSTSSAMNAEEYYNPFVARKRSLTYWDWARITIMTFGLFIPRSILSFLILSTFGIGIFTLEFLPNSSKLMRSLTIKTGRFLFFVWGFNYIEVIDEHGNPFDARQLDHGARIIVVAPHSTFFDVIAIAMLGAPSPIAKRSATKIPIIGQALLSLTPLLVDRASKTSRKDTLSALKRRANNPNEPPIMIFPEATNTNRSSLVQFRIGAFTPMKPVRPVLLHYDEPPGHDCVTWSWEGAGAKTLLFYLFTRFSTRLKITILDEVDPLKEGIESNPIAFAEEVCRRMSKVGRIPVSDYSLTDAQYIAYCRDQGIPRTVYCIRIVHLMYTFHRLMKDTPPSTSIHQDDDPLQEPGGSRRRRAVQRTSFEQTSEVVAEDFDESEKVPKVEKSGKSLKDTISELKGFGCDYASTMLTKYNSDRDHYDSINLHQTDDMFDMFDINSYSDQIDITALEKVGDTLLPLLIELNRRVTKQPSSPAPGDTSEAVLRKLSDSEYNQQLTNHVYSVHACQIMALLSLVDIACKDKWRRLKNAIAILSRISFIDPTSEPGRSRRHETMDEPQTRFLLGILCGLPNVDRYRFPRPIDYLTFRIKVLAHFRDAVEQNAPSLFEDCRSFSRL